MEPSEHKFVGRIDPESWRDEFRKKFTRRLKRGIKGSSRRKLRDEKAG